MRLAPAAAALPAQARLPLVDLAVPSLKRLSAAQYGAFRENVRVLVAADERIDLFEYVLQRAIMRHVEPQFNRAAVRGAIEYYAIAALATPCEGLISALAQAGAADEASARQAFALAAARLGLALEFRPGAGLDAVDRALEAFSKASPGIKQRVLDACVVCIAADGRATLEEAELLRAVADGLDCPLPPFLPGQMVA